MNTHLIPISDFIRDRDFNFQRGKVNSVLHSSLREDSTFLEFTKAAEALLGDAIATNMMMMGFAYQRGLLPVAAASIEQAIELNGVSIKMNMLAFQLGRLSAADPARVIEMMKSADPVATETTLDDMSLDDIIAHRSQLLADYQGGRLVKRYRKLVDRVRAAAEAGGYGDALPRAAAIAYAKLLAYKDEYEVARLYTDDAFAKQVSSQFEGDFKLSFHLAPPMLPGVDASGRPLKRKFGAYMLPAFRVLKNFRFLRGTPFDPFGYSEDRKVERQLISSYEEDVDAVLKVLSPMTAEIGVALLALPDSIRGYGPVKMKSVEAAALKHAALRKELHNPPPLIATQVAAE